MFRRRLSGRIGIGRIDTAQIQQFKRFALPSRKREDRRDRVSQQRNFLNNFANAALAPPERRWTPTPSARCLGPSTPLSNVVLLSTGRPLFPLFAHSNT